MICACEANELNQRRLKDLLCLTNALLHFSLLCDMHVIEFFVSLYNL